jgi:hypothetical protein
MGLSFHFPKLWRGNGVHPTDKSCTDINREKGEQQKGNNHAKDPERQYFIQGNRRPQTAAYGILS